MNELADEIRARSAVNPRMRPRIGFLGVGWIGRHRLEAIAKSDFAEIVLIADPAADLAAQAREFATGATLASSLDELLRSELDGVVIATPSALHAEQTIQAAEHGLAVFCQKPLGRTAAETRRAIEAAKAADCLLAVDLSYRFINGMRKIRDLVQAGELGRVFAVDLVFHNAYGPDKAWFYDAKLSGGGCVIDLGIHLVDLALWTLDFSSVKDVSSRLFARGEPLQAGSDAVEDYALARLDLDSGTIVQLTCSWNLHAGCDAVITAAFYGTEGGAAISNTNGSFYHFTAERFRGTQREVIDAPHDNAWEWGGQAAVEWTRRLGEGEGYDRGIERLVDVATVLDRIYQR